MESRKDSQDGAEGADGDDDQEDGDEPSPGGVPRLPGEERRHGQEGDPGIGAVFREVPPKPNGYRGERGSTDRGHPGGDHQVQQIALIRARCRIPEGSERSMEGELIEEG